MKPRLLFCCLLVLASLACPFGSSAQDASPGYLLVANQGDRAISIIDAAAEKQIALVPEGAVTGHEVAASPDGRTAYVPIYGNAGVGRAGTDGSILETIDIPTQKVTGHLDFGHGVRPHCVIYDRVSGNLYVTTELEKAVTIIDPKTLRIIGQVPTGEEQSHMLTLTHDGARGFTANVSTGTVSVLDMVGRKTLAIIQVAPKVQRISISKDDKWVFTSDTTQARLAVIDTQTLKVVDWIALPGRGYGTASTLDGSRLFVAVPGNNLVAVVDLAQRKVVETIPVPATPQEILMRPDGAVAYVSCMVSHEVAVIDLALNKVRKVIEAGKGADGLAWAKVTQVANGAGEGKAFIRMQYFLY